MTPRWIAGHGYVDSWLPEAWKRMGYRCRRDPSVSGRVFAVHRPDGTAVDDARGRTALLAWETAIASDIVRQRVRMFSSLDSDNLDGVYEAALDELERDPSIGWQRAIERARGNL